MNRLTRPQLACLIALPLALAACGKDKEPDTKAEAAGEILPGSIDDAMLPMDTVRSQPPLVPQTDAAAKAGKATEGAEEPAEIPAEAGATPDSGPAPVVALPTAPATPASTSPAKAQ